LGVDTPSDTAPSDYAAASGEAQVGGAPILVATGLSYSYLDRYPALTDVSVTIQRGERVALLGANGCGKSTLLKVLDGLIFPSAGSYTAFGEKVTEDTLEDEQMSEGFRSRVGFVFQNSDAQVFSPTVREEIAFGPLMLGITDLLNRAPYQLSGGQKKKIAIATVLVMGPEVLLFDEPTAALDPRTQYWLMDLIEQLGAAGKTIVHATHDLGTLYRIADRCVVFSEDHRIVTEGTPEETLANRDLLRQVNLIHEHSTLPSPPR
jgi:cobalt/nickel transport system ATP-binding protein